MYFWTVAREGSITKATKLLHLTPQTISGQLKLLEEAIGEPLFNREGRGLTLSETGHMVFQYADEIFSLGAELSERMKSGNLGLPETLKVGILNSIPKLIAFRILKPALEYEDPLRLSCIEGDLDLLLGKLAVHQLDIIISDCALPAGSNVKAFSHAIGTSKIAFFAHKSKAKQYARNFPASLNGAPVLLPSPNTPLRRAMEDWFDQQNLRPVTVADFDDSALMKAFGEAGVGVFPSLEVMRDEIEAMYKCLYIGSSSHKLRESFFVISPERKLKHPVVRLLIDNARASLFEV